MFYMKTNQDKWTTTFLGLLLDDRFFVEILSIAINHVGHQRNANSTLGHFSSNVTKCHIQVGVVVARQCRRPKGGADSLQ